MPVRSQTCHSIGAVVNNLTLDASDDQSLWATKEKAGIGPNIQEA